MNDTIKGMLNHRSVRRYTAEPVTDEQLHAIIAAVQAAPNWVNLQQVSIVCVKEQSRRDKLAELCGGQPWVSQAPVFLAFCADYYRMHLALKMHGEDFAQDCWNPDLLLVGAHECGIALEAAVVAAESLGLSCVPIGALRMNAPDVVKLLNLPKYVLPMIGFCLGHADGESHVKPRLPMQAVFFEETYNQDLTGYLEEFDKEYEYYYAHRGSNQKIGGDWTDSAAQFYKPPYPLYLKDPETFEMQGFFPCAGAPEGIGK